MSGPVQGDKRTADEVCTPALFWVMRGLGRRGSGGTTRQMSVTQLCFKLNPKEHLGYFWTFATSAQQGKLRYLRAAQKRQLYQACVIPRMDYASTVWHKPTRNRWQIIALNTMQRIAMTGILSAFRTAPTIALEAETFLLPTHLRLLQRAKEVMTKLLTLSCSHPITRIIDEALGLKAQPRWAARTHLGQGLKTLTQEQRATMERIDTCPDPPWEDRPFDLICIEADREAAAAEVAKATRDPNTAIYTDASAKDGSLGAAVVMLDQNETVCMARPIVVGSCSKWTVPAAELIAIYYAIDLAIYEQKDARSPRPRTYTIFSDCRSGLQAIANPIKKPNTQIIQEINDIARRARRDHHIGIRLRWIPSHSGIKGNEEADKLAKTSVGALPNHKFSRLASLQKRDIQKEIRMRWKEEWDKSPQGQHLRKIDSAIPGPHVRKLYDHLPRHRTSLLTQLRIGHTWLRSYQKRIGKSDSDKCECGAIETIIHVLVDCPRLREPRTQLRQKIKERFNSLSTMLGGRKPGSDGKRVSITVDELQAVLDFAEQSGRFRKRDTVNDDVGSG